MRFLRLTAFIAAALMSASAQAVLVPSWTWTVSTEFIIAPPALGGPSPVYDPAAPIAPTTTSTASLLTWGTSTGTGQSSLAILNSPASSPPLAITGGGTVPTQSFVHTNRPITGQTLDNVRVMSSISLTPSGGGPTFSDSAEFFIDFKETPNVGPCTAGPPNPTSVCDDIFVLSGGTAGFMFDFDGATYTVDIIPLGGLSPLSAAQCAVAGATAPCFGFITPENAETTVAFAFQIAGMDHNDGPEPGTLALLGLGLLGVGWSTRRRRRS